MTHSREPAKRMKNDLQHLDAFNARDNRMGQFVNQYRCKEKESRKKRNQITDGRRLKTACSYQSNKNDDKQPSIIGAHRYSGNVHQHKLPLKGIEHSHYCLDAAAAIKSQTNLAISTGPA